MDFLDKSENRWTTFVTNFFHIHHFWSTLFSKSEHNEVSKTKKVSPTLLLFKRSFSAIRNWFLIKKTDFESWNFSTFKCSAKNLYDLPREIYTLSKFVLTRTIHIINRQGKIFYLYAPYSTSWHLGWNVNEIYHWPSLSLDILLERQE